MPNFITPQDIAEESADLSFELNQLLAEAEANAAEHASVNAARKILKRNDTSAADREASQALVASWEVRREWLPVAHTLVFNVQLCDGCGSHHSHVVGVFQQQEHRTSKVSRWVRPAAVGDFPRNIKRQIEHVQVCVTCAAAAGWVGGAV